MALARRDTEREAGTEQERGKLYQYLWDVLIEGLQGQLQHSIGVSEITNQNITNQEIFSCPRVLAIEIFH